MSEKSFFDLYPNSEFRHRAELKSGLEETSWDFSSFTGGERNKVTGQILLKAYGAKFEDPSVPAEQGFGELVPKLEEKSESIIEIWSFVGPQDYINVFIDQKTNEVLASVLTPA
jgi:hypothetical protein